MEYHYLSINMVWKARIKILKAKLKKASRRQKEKDRLQTLAEASLAQHNTWWRTLNPNFKKFGTLFVIFEFLAQKTEFSAQCVTPPGARFWWRPPFEENLAYVDFSWKNMHAHKWPRNFDRFCASKKVKNTPKMTFLPLFGHTGRNVGRTQFWRGKWRPNSEIILLLKIIQAYLSNKPTWRKFGHREGLQNQLQTSATHREIRRGALEDFAHFLLSNYVFHLVSWKFDFSPSNFENYDVI